MEGKVILVLSCLFLLAPYYDKNLVLVFGLGLLLYVIGKVNRFAYAGLAISVLLVNVILLHIQYHWGLKSLDSRFEAVYEAPNYEAIEYMKNYFNLMDLFILTYFAVTICLIIRHFITYKSNLKKIRSRSFVIMTAIFIVMPFFVSVKQVLHFPPFDLIQNAYAAQESLRHVRQRAEFIKTHMKKESCSDDYQKIVLVIGEASLKDRMSIYGYKKKTTPFLESLKPYILDAISPTNQTRFSVPLMLSDATVYDFSSFFHSLSLVSKLRGCGYETYWVSNQGHSGELETNISSIGMKADHTYFLNKSSYSQAGYDEKILDILDKIKISPDSKQAFFIHLMGSHVEYNRRYPPEHSLLSGSDIDSQYDNSIYYTDYVLSEIFAKFRHEKLLFAYISDHGEVVSKEKNGHGFYPGFKDEYRIPLIVWTAKNEKIEKIKKDADKKIINGESFNALIEFLTGLDPRLKISCSDYIFSLSPENRLRYSNLRYFDQHL